MQPERGSVGADGKAADQAILVSCDLISIRKSTMKSVRELLKKRLGEVAVVTTPFELFIDYGMRIRARSKAIMTFVVQLSCGHSEYLPTTRAIRGGGYSAELYLVGPEGGRVLVDEAVRQINDLWP